MCIYLPPYHPEKGTDHTSLAIATLTAFQHLFYFLQDNNYFKGLIFKNKDYTLSRILFETLKDIAKCFPLSYPGIWQLATLVPLPQVIVYVFSDCRLA